jgi:hypothetical protein
VARNDASELKKFHLELSLKAGSARVGCTTAWERTGEGDLIRPEKNQDVAEKLGVGSTTVDRLFDSDMDGSTLEVIKNPHAGIIYHDRVKAREYYGGSRRCWRLKMQKHVPGRNIKILRVVKLFTTLKKLIQRAEQPRRLLIRSTLMCRAGLGILVELVAFLFALGRDIQVGQVSDVNRVVGRDLVGGKFTHLC